MAGAATFPTTQAENVSYAKDVVPYLIANKVRLSITNENTGIMNAKLTEVDAIWTQHEDPLQKGNEIINEKTGKRINEMLDILDDVYDDIPQSALTEDDKKKLRIFDKKPKGTRPKITTAPFSDLKVGDGGTVKVTNRVESDSERASRHEDAEQIEMAYQIGGTAPVGASGTTLRQTFTKAIHTLQFDVNENSGKTLYAFFRWRNAVNPEKSSPWGQIMTIVISN